MALVSGDARNEVPQRTVLSNGIVEYRVRGKLHRLDGPAKIYPNGTEEYYENNQLHREDGPAVFSVVDGTRIYYLRGKIHREDGPAVVLVDFCNVVEEYIRIEYYHDDKRHRLNGPARIWSNGTTEYWVEGKQISFIAYKLLRLKLFCKRHCCNSC